MTDREKLIELLQYGMDKYFLLKFEAEVFADLLIKNGVTVQKHGRWEDHLVRDWHCSECGKKVPKQVRFDGYCYADKLNYCPNCGARMDLEG